MNIEAMAEEELPVTQTEQDESETQPSEGENDSQPSESENGLQPGEDESGSDDNTATEEDAGWDGVTTESVYEGENFKVTFALSGY